MSYRNSNTGKVIIPANMHPKPRQHEIDIAAILAEQLKTNVEFIPTTDHNTADFLIKGMPWELKSPQGNGKHNIQRQLQYASHQSANVIISATRSKMHHLKIRREVEAQFKVTRSVKRLLFISKDKKVIEIFR